MRKFIAALALAMIPTYALSNEYKVGDLVIDHPAAKATPTTAMTAAGYVTITNTGDATDTLIAVEADFDRVEIHDTKVENDIASMFRIEGAVIAPGDTLTFAPGGKHIMFMGLGGDPFEEGETVNGTLVFENAGRIDIVFDVETLEQIVERLGHSEAGMEMDHGEGHDDHSNH
jgi:copper(I)-binding protein